MYIILRLLTERCFTWKNSFNVPSGQSIDDSIYIQHHNGGGKVVAVSLHGAGFQVKPLDPHTLLFILREILTAKTKGHRRQEALQGNKSLLQMSELQGLLETDRSLSCHFLIIFSAAFKSHSRIYCYMCCVKTCNGSALTAKILCVLVRYSLQATHSTYGR